MPKFSTITFAEFAPTFLEAMTGERAPGTVMQYRLALTNYLLPAFGSMHLSQITRGPVTAWYHKLPNTQQRRNVYMILRRVMITAVAYELIPDWKVSVSGAAKTRAKNRPTFTPAQFRTVLGNVDEFYRPHLMICAGAALRIAELAGLNMGDWDPETGKLSIERQWLYGAAAPIKNGEVGSIYPLDLAVPYLNEIARDAPTWRKPSDPMLRGKQGKRLDVNALRNVWNEGRHLSKLDAFHIHDLRHLAISAMARSSGDLKETQSFARHKNPQTTLGYMHGGSDERKREFASRASAEFGFEDAA